MREQLQTRLEQLRREFEVGQNRMVSLDTEMADLRQTLLRISGAIQVLEELLAADGERDGAHTLEVIDGRVAR